MPEQPSQPGREWQRRICIPAPDESIIRMKLQRVFPALTWKEGDSSWDKIRVWGEGQGAAVAIYRYESPGPFQLTIHLQAPSAAGEDEFRTICDAVLLALSARLWKPLEPRPVTLVKPNGRFPAAYAFECSLCVHEIETLLTDADFWYWQAFGRTPTTAYLEGRIPFHFGGKPRWNCPERVRLSGALPSYRIDVGLWPDETARTPTCGEVHEIVQTTLLPALGARNVTAAD